jgi:internalin A
VTDAGVIHLAKLPALRILTLHSTAVTSKGLRALCQLPSLRWLEIHSESVGDEEIAELRGAFPSLQINTNPLR